MPTVELTLPNHRYDVRIDAGLLRQLGTLVREVAPHARAALLVDEGIADSHGRTAARALSAADYDAVVGVMPTGEEHKTLGSVRGLYNVLLDARLERRSPVIALGGGITGDTAGFVAATYLRGVPFIQVPTTLLAMVDASVGGKVGVNVPQGKNLIGAFHQPHRVVIDVDTLSTLPDRELRCGLAECVKHAVIRDPSLFDWIEANLDRIKRLDPPTMIELVERNVRIKAAVVMEDEKESPGGVRAHLNFGHTFAHAIEAVGAFEAESPAPAREEKLIGGVFTFGNRTTTKPKPAGPAKLDYHHGEAVSLGMVAATRLATGGGLCEPTLLPRLVGLLQAIGLPTSAPDLPPPDHMLELMRLDKKVKDARLRLVLPVKMGEVVVTGEVPDDAVAAAWASLSAK